MKMKKLLFAAYSLDLGGIEKALVTLTNELQKRGYDITIVLEKKQGIFLEELDPKIHVIEYAPNESRNMVKRKVMNLIKRMHFILQYQNKFDFIMFRHTLEHIPDFMDVLRQALPLLKEDGVLCIETPNQESLVQRIRGYKVRDERFLADLYPPTHINAFCRRSYKAIANTLHLDVAQCLTYSPGDPKWFGRSGYKSRYRGFKAVIHGLCTQAGMGLNIAVFLKKRLAGDEDSRISAGWSRCEIRQRTDGTAKRPHLHHLGLYQGGGTAGVGEDWG